VRRHEPRAVDASRLTAVGQEDDIVTGHWWADALLGVAAALLVCWLLLILTLALGNRTGASTSEALRILPDLVRLMSRVSRDRSIPLSLRIRIWALLAYLASPIDLVPDVIPVIGYADDVVITVLVLRSVVRRVGIAGLRRHWPGTEDGFVALSRLGRLDPGSG
jgi:uncharacterized membrane protein YkvA (DUF1232 family)